MGTLLPHLHGLDQFLVIDNFRAVLLCINIYVRMELIE